MSANLSIFGITTMKSGKSFWTRIGKAFQNRDGSMNLLFNFLPADLVNTRIQIREEVRDSAPVTDEAPHAEDPNQGVAAQPF